VFQLLPLDSRLHCKEGDDVKDIKASYYSFVYGTCEKKKKKRFELIFLRRLSFFTRCGCYFLMDSHQMLSSFDFIKKNKYYIDCL
jgi:hypothetical protein